MKILVKSLVVLLTFCGLIVNSSATTATMVQVINMTNGSQEDLIGMTGNNQAEVNRIALKRCGEEYKGRKCALHETKAIARAIGGGKEGISSSGISADDASAKALKFCGNKDCKIDWVITTPGFWATAFSETSTFTQYGGIDFNNTIEAAKEGCERKAKSKCEVKGGGAIFGEIKEEKKSEASVENCRPKTSVINCSSQCTNGSCVVTYTNGCKIRVQVRPKFDPFTNQWQYPSPSC